MQQSQKLTLSFVKKLSDNLDNRIDRVGDNLNDLSNKLDKKDQKDEERYNKVMDVLNWLTSQFKRFDEEHTILSHHQFEQNDRIAKLESVIIKSS